MPQPSTTDLLRLRDIQDGIVVLKDGSLRAILEVSAVNFELRSSDEQAAILQQFQAFLNSVDFPVQMVVHSRKFDISAYLALVQEAAGQLTNDLLKLQADEYIRFIGELSELANVMSKKFYIALPFSVVAASSGGGGFFKGLFSRKPKQETNMSPEQIASYKSQLRQRADVVLGGLSGLGLKGRLLEQQDLIALFTDLYNPTVPKTTHA